MLEKEGTEGEEEAKRAYIAAREVADHAAEVATGNKVSSALIEKVCLSVSLYCMYSM
jgi:LETM1 and EF-hand domain-containing protein 1, mitochondrial